MVIFLFGMNGYYDQHQYQYVDLSWDLWFVFQENDVGIAGSMYTGWQSQWKQDLRIALNYYALLIFIYIYMFMNM